MPPCTVTKAMNSLSGDQKNWSGPEDGGSFGPWHCARVERIDPAEPPSPLSPFRPVAVTDGCFTRNLNNTGVRLWAECWPTNHYPVLGAERSAGLGSLRRIVRGNSDGIAVSIQIEHGLPPDAGLLDGIHDAKNWSDVDEKADRGRVNHASLDRLGASSHRPLEP